MITVSVVSPPPSTVESSSPCEDHCHHDQQMSGLIHTLAQSWSTCDIFSNTFHIHSHLKSARESKKLDPRRDTTKIYSWRALCCTNFTKSPPVQTLITKLCIPEGYGPLLGAGMRPTRRRSEVKIPPNSASLSPISGGTIFVGRE